MSCNRHESCQWFTLASDCSSIFRLLMNVWLPSILLQPFSSGFSVVGFPFEPNPPQGVKRNAMACLPDSKAFWSFLSGIVRLFVFFPDWSQGVDGITFPLWVRRWEDLRSRRSFHPGLWAWASKRPVEGLRVGFAGSWHKARTLISWLGSLRRPRHEQR